MSAFHVRKIWAYVDVVIVLGLLILLGVSIASAATGLGDTGLVHSCVNPTSGAIIIQPTWKKCAVPYSTTLDWNTNGTVLTGNFLKPVCAELDKNCNPLYYGTGVGMVIIEKFAANVYPVDGTLDVLMVKVTELDEMPRNGEFRFAVIKNGSPTSLVCNVAYASYPNLTCKSSAEIPIKAGDTISLQITSLNPDIISGLLAMGTGSFAIHIR
jgi:hypothetical protein